jgi:type IV secretion system protein VirB1
MMPIDFTTLAQQCAPVVSPATLQAIVKTESGFNPYAIGVVGGHLARQPRTRDEAVATVRALEAAGWNYSMGLSQVNRTNLARYGLDMASVFEPCANLRAGAAILADCYTRASANRGAGQAALLAAFSCYYSGNFTRGFQADAGHTSYVQRVSANVPAPSAASGVVPAIAVVPDGAGPAPRTHARSVSRPASTSVRSNDAPSNDRPGWDAFGAFRTQ